MCIFQIRRWVAWRGLSSAPLMSLPERHKNGRVKAEPDVKAVLFSVDRIRMNRLSARVSLSGRLD